MPVIIKKYEFHTKKTNFVGFIIKLKQISIDLEKIKAIVNQLDKIKPFTRIIKKSKI